MHVHAVIIKTHARTLRQKFVSGFEKMRIGILERTHVFDLFPFIQI